VTGGELDKASIDQRPYLSKGYAALEFFALAQRAEPARHPPPGFRFFPQRCRLKLWAASGPVRAFTTARFSSPRAQIQLTAGKGDASAVFGYSIVPPSGKLPASLYPCLFVHYQPPGKRSSLVVERLRNLRESPDFVYARAELPCTPAARKVPCQRGYVDSEDKTMNWTLT
jgi:hypothetical protein